MQRLDLREHALKVLPLAANACLSPPRSPFKHAGFYDKNSEQRRAPQTERDTPCRTSKIVQPIHFFFCECAACCLLNSNLKIDERRGFFVFHPHTPFRHRGGRGRILQLVFSFLQFFFFFFCAIFRVLRIRYMCSTISWRVVPPINPGCDLYSLPPHPCVPGMGCLVCATGCDPDVSGWRCTHRRSLTSFSLSRSPTAGRQEHHNYRRRRL